MCLNSAGVYKIYINNWLYIGSTTRSFKVRFREHNHRLKVNKHCNKILQNLYNKYGKLNFEVLEEIANKDLIIQREQYLINELSPNINICTIAGNTFNKQHSIETKLRIKNSLIKNYEDKILRDNLEPSKKWIRKKFEIVLQLKEIIQYDLYGNFIKRWENSKYIKKELNLSPKQINKVCNGKHKTCGGFMWKFYNKNIDFTKKIEPVDKKIVIKPIKLTLNGLFCKKCNKPLVNRQKVFCSKNCCN